MVKKAQPFTIRVKIVFLSVIILFFTIGIITLVNSYLFTNEYTGLLENNAYILARDLKSKIDKLLNLGIRIETLTNFDKQCRELVEEYDFISYALITDRNGKILYHNDPLRKGITLYREEFIRQLSRENFLRNTITYKNHMYYEVLIPVFRDPENTAASPTLQTDALWDIAGIAGIGFPVRIIQARINTVILASILIAVISFGSSLFLLLFTLSRLITQPITQLVAVIREISSHNNLDRKVPIKSQDEIGQLSATFNAMTTELFKNRNIMIEKERIEKELEIAKMIQTSLLPGITNTVCQAYDISAAMLPATEVGGDYYDIIPGYHEKLWFGIGDVAGHGLRSGLVMMMLQTAAYSYINDLPSLSPRELIIKTNEVLYENIRNRMQTSHYMTLSFFTGNRDGEFTFAGKHLPVIIYRSSRQACELIETGGFWCGFLKDIASRTQQSQFKLAQNDILFLYSDGIIEAMNDSRNMYGYQRFTDCITGICQHNRTPASGEIKEAVLDNVRQFMQQQNDDITLLVIRKK